MPDDAKLGSSSRARLRILPDAMVLAAGLTSRRNPASYSRRVVEASIEGRIEIVLTTTLLAEARAVLVDPEFRGHLPEAVADTLLDVLRTVAVEVIDDVETVAPRRCADPDDDYLVDAALRTDSMLVSRDNRADFASVTGLDGGRPGAALRRAGLFD